MVGGLHIWVVWWWWWPRCCRSPRPRVHVQDAPVCAFRDARVFQTCGRFERNTQGRSNALASRSTHAKQHTAHISQHTQNNTPQVTKNTPPLFSSSSPHTHINMHTPPHTHTYQHAPFFLPHHTHQHAHTSTCTHPHNNPHTSTCTLHTHRHLQDTHINNKTENITGSIFSR